MKVTNNVDNDEKYKYDNSQAPKSNESVRKKTEELEALIERLMSTNSLLKVVNDVIGTISSCGKNMIEFEKKHQEKINGNIVMLFHYCHC